MSWRTSTNTEGNQNYDPESIGISRGRSLVRPDRSRIDENHPRFHYAQIANQESDHIRIQPSTTGLDPHLSYDTELKRESTRNLHSLARSNSLSEEEGIPLMDMKEGNEVEDLKGGREVFGLNDETEKSPPKSNFVTRVGRVNYNENKKARPGFDLWKIYCYLVTFWAPPPLLKLFGMPNKPVQYAWREKIALISCILYIAAFVCYLIFGFTATVCTNFPIRMRVNEVSSGYLIINGRAYDLTHSQHPKAAGIGEDANVLYPPVNAGGMDASFLFQNVNGNCKGLIKPRDNCTIPKNDNDELAWYMPCNLFNQDGSTSPNFTVPYYKGYACHTSGVARQAYYGMEKNGDVYFTWDDINNSSRNLIVYSGEVLDLDLIDWIQKDDLTYPELFDKLKEDKVYRGHDLSLVLTKNADRQAARCLTEIIKVGSVDSRTIGCIASSVVLYCSLVFILSVIIIKFLMAVYFRLFLAGKQGAAYTDNKSMFERSKEIENWVDDPAGDAPIGTVPLKARANYKPAKTNRQSVFNKGKFSLGPNDLSQYYMKPDKLSKTFEYTTMTTQAALIGRNKNQLSKSATQQSGLYLNDYSASTEFLNRPSSIYNPFDASYDSLLNTLSTDIIHPSVIPQPPVEYQPFGFPLAHVLALVTCYSEDEDGIRTTLNSIATSDYPNSHKLLFVVCDGMIKGSGNDLTTPEIVLNMMTDFTVPPDDVKSNFYVAVAKGSKRRNMAKVYAGYYKYNDDSVPPEKQQKIPMVTIVKCGTPEEAVAPKPGNRGKRDSQIILMSFLQRIMFDERMTELEFEILNNIWRITGLMANFYEAVLMVDADTKVYPDSLTHMMAEIVRDPMIMGLCGETKISNKLQSWVTAIQVFEYYISHHQAKGFESVFGGVTCLPGCFSIYRIKSPKGSNGYWVPILANPDIVERYSDNVVETLHRKNLLLLGEDRYLSSLMLKTFPKRKQVFVPKAACKTVVPDKFKVLLSQRRRWINSTIHNLMELILVNDLCGTFCFSMQFCIFMELVGTLILPAAICFTIYVCVFAIVSHPTPILSLVLLALVLGLPSLLIVVTVSSWSYFVYWLIYILALPIWNFVLPVYAYWKFDDFSWGDTRSIAGGDKGDHSNPEGEFDSSNIYMRRWREFERERRSHLTTPDAAWDPSN